MNQVSVIPNLWIGDYESASDYNLLTSYAITHIISLYRTPKFPNYFEYMCITIEDIECADIAQYFTQTNAFIDNGLQYGFGVLVHCAAGVSRSATIVLAYMMHKLKLNCADAFKILQHDRSCVCPNKGFMIQLNANEN